MTSLPTDARFVRQMDTAPTWMPVEQRYQWAVAGAAQSRPLIGAAAPRRGVVYRTVNTALHPFAPYVTFHRATERLLD